MLACGEHTAAVAAHIDPQTQIMCCQTTALLRFTACETVGQWIEKVESGVASPAFDTPIVVLSSGKCSNYNAASRLWQWTLLRRQGLTGD